MTLVVDASVAAKWLLDEPDSERAVVYLAEALIAPALLRLECASAVLKRVRIGQLDKAEARQRLSEIDLMPIELIPVDEAAAIELALELSHPIYDCAYLALARERRLQVITADRRFLVAAEKAGYAASIRLFTPHP